MKKYSVVIPVYNESESLPQLLEELSSVATENGHEPEIIFVDDGIWSMIFIDIGPSATAYT